MGDNGYVSSQTASFNYQQEGNKNCNIGGYDYNFAVSDDDQDDDDNARDELFD